MTRVLILDTPSPLAVRSGEVVEVDHLMLTVKLDYSTGYVYCKPCELIEDTLPTWLPDWLRLWLKLAQRKWRRIRYDHHHPCVLEGRK